MKTLGTDPWHFGTGRWKVKGPETTWNHPASPPNRWIRFRVPWGHKIDESSMILTHFAGKWGAKFKENQRFGPLGLMGLGLYFPRTVGQNTGRTPSQGETCLKQLKMKNWYFLKKLNLIGKTRWNRKVLVKSWWVEDQYRIIFYVALWPERPQGIDFFEKSWELESDRRPESLKIDKNWAQGTTLGICQCRMDARSSRTTLGLVLRPKTPKKNVKNRTNSKNLDFFR